MKEFFEKYLVLICAVALISSKFAYVIAPYLYGLVATTSTFIFTCYHNQEKNYLNKVLLCIRIAVLASLIAFPTIIFISYLNAPAWPSEKFTNPIYFLAGGFFSLFFNMVAFAFLVPIFFSNDTENREDILDM